MNRLTNLIVLGYVSQKDWGSILRKGARGFLTSGLFLNWIACAFFALSLAQAMHLAHAHQWLRGEWVDRSLSEVLSEKLGSPTRVQDVRFLGWTGIGFGHLEIRRADGALMVSAQSGTIRLKRIAWQKSGFFETEIVLRGAEMTRFYYRETRPQRFWSRWMHRPIGMRHLTALVRQNDERTSIRIVECRSEDLNVQGEVVFERSGNVRDGLQMSMSPWKFLAAAV